MTDIDRTIAEIRGENRWDTCESVKNGSCRPWDFKSDPCNTCPNLPYKPYTTDISAAMELWEEMKGTLTVLKLEVFSNQCFVRYDGEHDIFTHKAETECLAICGAFIKWKETK